MDTLMPPGEKAGGDDHLHIALLCQLVELAVAMEVAKENEPKMNKQRKT
jgi:hypothetical protein